MIRKSMLAGTALTLSLLMNLPAAAQPAATTTPPLQAKAQPAAGALRLAKGVVAGPTVEGITEYRLPNGLTVLFYPDASTPTMTVNVTYGVGAANESYGETGMAHLLEHLLFKGTPRTASFAAEFKKRGISFNGTTGQDRTNYYGSFAKDNATLEWLLRAEADRMVNSFIARKDLDSEMTVVRNEMEIGENRPGQVLGQRLRAQAYLWHKYGQGPIGNRSDVENVPIERLQAFYRKWYQPDTATVIVAGDFDPAFAMKVIQDSFGRIKRPARSLIANYTVEPTQDGEREIVVRRVGERDLLAIGYHTPAFAHPDSAALDVLMDVMNDVSGRLQKSMVETRLALGTDAGVDSFRDPGMAMFYATVNPGGDPAKVEKALLGQVETSGGRPFTDAEIADAKARILNRYRRVSENVAGLGHIISEYIGAGDWRLLFLHRDQIAKVTAADVNRVAAAYFKPSNRTIARFVPTPQPDRVEIGAAPSPAEALSDYVGQPVLATGDPLNTDAEDILAHTQYATLGDGLQVALYPRKTRGDLVTMMMTSRYGSEQTSIAVGEAPNFLNALLMSGTKTLGKEQLARRIEELRARIAITAAGRFTSVRITAPRENFATTLALVMDILRNPALPEDEFIRIRDRSLAVLQSKDQSPGAVADEAMQKHFDRWPKGHPDAYRTTEDHVAAVKRVTLDDVRTFHRTLLGTAQGQVGVVGDFDPAQMKSLLLEQLGGWQSGYRYQRETKPFFQPAKVVREVIETPDKANAVIVARSNFALNVNDPDYAALLLAARIFGSGAMSSRLGNRVRVQEGLSYYVGSNVIVSPMDTNSIFYMQATSAPENMAKVETGMTEELARFVRDGVTPAELEDAKNGLLMTMADRRSSELGLADTLRGDLFFGRTMQWTVDLEAKMRSLTADQVGAAIRRNIKPEAMSSFIAGDFKRVRQQVAQNGN